MVMQLDTFPSQAEVGFPFVNIASSTCSNTCSNMQEQYKLNAICCVWNLTYVGSF